MANKKINKEITAESIIAEGKALEAKIQKTKQPGHSSVSKASRGISDDLVTTWVAFDATVKTQTIILNAAKAANKNVMNFLADYLRAAFDANWEQVQIDGNSYEPRHTRKNLDDMTLEELEKFIADEEKRVLALQAKAEYARTIVFNKVNTEAKEQI